MGRSELTGGLLEPEVVFMDGVRRTINWYFREKNREEVRGILNRMLTER